MRLIAIGLCLLLGGCSTLGIDFAGVADVGGVVSDGKDSDDSTQGSAVGLKGTSYTDISDKSVRYVTRAQLAGYACGLQSKGHNDQRVMTEVSIERAPLVILKPDGSYESISLDSKPTTFTAYNPAIPPFNMSLCLAEAQKNGWERSFAILADWGKTAVPWYGGYKIVDKGLDTINNLADRDSLNVNGNDNDVIVQDNNVDNESTLDIDNRRGIETSELEFQPVGLETPGPLGCRAGFTLVPGENRCSDGFGGSEPPTQAGDPAPIVIIQEPETNEDE